MAWFNKKHGNTKEIEAEIDSLLEDMSIEERDSESYAKMADAVEKLCKAKSYEKTSTPIDWTTVALDVTGCLLPVLLILNYEKLNVVASKAMMFVRRVH